MLRIVLVSLLVAASLADDFDDGINFRILKKNYLNKDLAGGIRFGVGYGVSYDSLEPSEVKFKRFLDGGYRSIDHSELGNVELAVYEEAYCDSEHEDNDPEDGVVDDDCNPAIKGFISVEKASCELAGRYLLEYKGSTRRFDIVVRNCDGGVGRYNWFEDAYWSDGDSDMEFSDYYNNGSAGIFLGVNEDNFLNKGILGGFRIRVGADDLDLEKLAVYKEGSSSLPGGMVLDKKIYQRTCNADTDSDDSDTDDSDDESDEKICKAAIYGFVTASPSECSMDGDYYLEYNGEKVEFEVHVKSCGKDDWDEYESDYLYDSDAEQ